MKQYQEMKKKHPDAVLLFRVGDFYECFGEDAVIASDILGITLTRRSNAQTSYVELAGFPHHALDTYLPRLVRAGKRVAICEQLDPVPRSRSLKESEPSRSLEYRLAQSKFIVVEQFIDLLIVINDIINHLNLLVEIRSHTQEIRRISRVFGVSPIKAFTGCFDCEPPTLFGC